MVGSARNEPARALRIGFDAACLDSTAPGVRRYTRKLVEVVPIVDPSIKLVAVDVEPGILQRGASNLGRMLVDLPLAARRRRLDLFHAPAYITPLWGVHPLVVTIHDVSYARHPEWYPYRRDTLRRLFYRRSARVADLVITDSGFSRREIIEAYAIDADRILTIALGVGAPFVSGRDRARNIIPEGVAAPFVLHVGDLHARRNLRTALQAVIAVRTRSKDLRALQLVLVGADRGEGEALRHASAQAGKPEPIVCLGVGLDDEHLAALYRSAGALIYPSRYEGFGLPLLEAMACGTPVIGSRAAATPEVVGDAALLVEPDDVEGFADAVQAALTNPALAEDLRARGLRRAASFTWERTARETIRAYRECVGVPAT